ncbi:MAG TPA: DUF1836 domain-containing protein [Candidatus Avilachnospira avicola]|nr:DUF1836 domain-containing protein [Candidatus Avilachnospira avicola]
MDNKKIYDEMIRFLDTISYVKPDKIPYIDIYMDQVTGIMDEHLKRVKRHEDDKILTKTMINNYTKAKILPPPEKKKYSREHMFLLLFIYYYKGILSLEDLKTILEDVRTRYFKNDDISVEDIYKEVFSMEACQMEVLKKDISQKFEQAQETFKDIKKEAINEDSLERLRLFSFACELGFDIYLKQLLLENICDRLHGEK